MAGDLAAGTRVGRRHVDDNIWPGDADRQLGV